MTPEQIGVIAGAVLTLFILSYLIGDNFLYRFATHLLVGAGAAYITFTVVSNVLIPRLIAPILSRGSASPIEIMTASLGLIFSVLLLFKVLPRWAWVGNIPVGYLVGVGAAVALAGAVFGTIGPQLQATAMPNPLLSSDSRLSGVLNVIIGVGTLTALISFGFYRAARRGILSGVNSIGRFFVAIALGATFALVYVASVTLFIDRLQAIANAAIIIAK